MSNILRFRSIIALTLAFWCAGTGCMIVSYARATTLSEKASPVAEAGAANSMDAHACCKARRKAEKRKAAASSMSDSRLVHHGATNVRLRTPARGSAMSCCPLTTNSIVAASSAQSPDNASALFQKSSQLFASDSSVTGPPAIPLRLPNRAHSYLLGCAFLI